MIFNGLDHIAIVVKDTETALLFYRDTLGLPLLFSEILEEQSVRLTHLDAGGVHLQLVQPLTESHPLTEHLRTQGEGLHHLCFKTGNVQKTMEQLPSLGLKSRDPVPRRGPRGRKAAFIDPATTRGILIEFTSLPPAE